ncbi:AraC family transcriptional regulator [Anaeroselena agilis]|uniref:AraC family transcriptional regulator n=1 Tax=Anaeroselena agilis TaxID=3063788 RepID=A0ABU3P3V0_9FIRM|nr:AraC family transcriptional regulator [Selenomonadales bacterium 4137-cl]
MDGITYYRDADVPFFELKAGSTDQLSYKKHYHEDFSVGLVEKGASRLWHEGRQAEVLPDSLVVIPPGVFHACNPRDRAHWQFKMLFVAPAWLDSVVPKGRPGGVRCLHGRAYERLMSQAAYCLMDSGAPLAKESCVLALFAALCGARDRWTDGGGGESAGLRQVREYLEAHFLDRITLASLEAVSGLSKYYIVKLFKKKYGVPPHVYQTMLRVNFAEKELRRQRDLAAVAQDAGFYDQSHFTKTFRSHVGVTPEVYQRAHS